MTIAGRTALAALALTTITGAASAPASAQSSERVPIRKTGSSNGVPVASGPMTSGRPMGRTDTVYVSRRDTLFMGRSDTTLVVSSCNCAPPPIPEPLREMDRPVAYGRGRGLGIGVAASVPIPVGGLRSAYEPGWGVNVPLTYDSPRAPFGVRLNLGYQELKSRGVMAGFGAADADPQQLFANLDARLRMPLPVVTSLLGPRSAVYGLAGVGVHHFRNYNEGLAFATTGTQNSGTSESITRPAVNAGAGLSIPVGFADLFGEGRYERVYLPGRAINSVPVNIGLNFNFR